MKDRAPLPHFLTVRQAAEALQLHPQTVYDHLRDGKIPGQKVGGCWRIPSAELVKTEEKVSA